VRRVACLCLVAVTIGCTGDDLTEPRAPGTPAASVTAADTGRYIVVLEGAQTDAVTTSASIASSLGITAERVYTTALRGFAATMTDAQAALLESDPRVSFVEPDQVVSIGATQSPTPSWGLDRIDQRALPLDDSYTFGPSGTGVTFYGLDTGIRPTHGEFAGRLQAGFTAIGDGIGTADCHGHGTHTAGTAAGTSYGVAKGAGVVPVRVLDCDGFGTTVGVIAGVDWVAANAELPAVANMSLGGGASAALDQAVANAVASGIVFTVSAGNDDVNACTQSPAREPAALTTGATTTTDQRSGFSNFGSCLDLFAPGSGITSAWYDADDASATMSGTSMAAPHVAGVAALYLDANPGASPSQVATAIIGNATPGAVGNPGTGSPNLLLYMGFLGGGPPPPPPPGGLADPVVLSVRTVAVPDPSRIRVLVQFEAPADADSIEVESSRSPSTVVYATPTATPWKGAWEAAWSQDQPPAEGCIVTARAVSDTQVSNDVQIDWCALVSNPPPPPPPPPPGVPADPVVVGAQSAPVPNPGRTRVLIQFQAPTDADSIQVETSRIPSIDVYATPTATPWKGAWEAAWSQDLPPAEGCLVTARAVSGSGVSGDVQIDWCVLAAGGPGS